VEHVRNTPFSLSWSFWPIGGDRIGVFASVLCAIHCAATPFLLLFLPVFGKVWAHPASHWIMALLVVPLAGVTVATGYKRHRRRWVIASGVLGIGFVLLGAAAPGFESNSGQDTNTFSVAGGPQSGPEGAADDSEICASLSECEESAGEESSECVQMASTEGDSDSAAGECVDACCPSIQATAEGGWKLHIPLASILTTIGGLFLIATHIGNLCRCACCDTEKAVA